MKKMLSLLAVAAVVGWWPTILPAAAAGDEVVQSAKPIASSFTLKMRILEGVRETSAEAAKPVTSSYLKYINLVNFDLERDIQAEQQIKKLYNLKDVSLLTEATLHWAKGKTDKASHMFRLNGQEYRVMVTPGRLPERNQFRIEVLEQSAAKEPSLLDTEFSLPDKSAAVFGFETTALKPYFISLRVDHSSDDPAGGGGGGARPVPTPPKLVKRVDPVYPEAAKKAGAEGTVILEARADTYGRVDSVKVLRSIPLLDQAAIDALKQWVYEPMVIDGKPRSVTFTVTVQFKLDDKKSPGAGGAAASVKGGVSTGVGGIEGGVAKGVEGGVVGGAPAGSASAQDLKKFEGDAVRAVGKIEPPKPITKVDPVYPREAAKAGVEGIVILEAKIDEQGDVVDARVLRSIPALDQAALDAVKQWKYEPLVVDGKPRKVIFTVTVRFALKDGKTPKTPETFARGAVKAEGDIEPPRQIKEVAPVYPEAARVAGVQGVVILSVRADEKGGVSDVMVLRSIPLLDQAAIDAVKQWVYEPKVIDGKAVPIVFTVTVRFLLK